MSDPDLRRAVHGVLLAAFAGTEVPDWVRDADGLGGVCLFATNTPDVRTTAALVTALRESHLDLVVTLDEEGGDVTRLEAATGSSLPGMAALGVLDDVEASGDLGRALGALVAACGLDLTLAPVVDVASDPRNVVIGARAISDDAAVVARHGAALVEGLHAAGVGACVKHAPGHGDTAVDSHLGVPTVRADLDTLHARELLPFRATIEAGVDAVMLGHLQVPALGPGLTSLTPAVPQLLRETGFTGPIVTDALDMGAVLELTDGDLGEASVQALLAGADLLCLGSPVNVDHALFAHVVASVTAAVEQGRVSRERLAEAGARARTLRRPQVAASDDPTEALAAVAEVGERLTRAAADQQGDVVLHPGDGLLDLRFAGDYAASSTQAVTPTALRDRLGLVAGEPVDRRLAVLTKDRSPAVRELLERRPDAVVLHVGYPGTAPEAAHRVRVQGAGLVGAGELVRRCAPA